jgi:ferric-dicitrate binding protein FerR (iron transport regulator)
MSQRELTALLRKYLSKECTPAEKQALASLIADIDNDVLLKASVEDIWNEYQPAEQLPVQSSDQYYERILQQIKPAGTKQAIAVAMPTYRTHFLRKGWVRLAAAAIIIAVAATAIYLARPLPAKQVAAKTALPNAGKPVELIRNITLPDGSSVVLQANSTLDYPRSFTGQTREVTLTGEAYFDVAHDTAHPFIIHSGNIKTTVLGTAFNIKAWPADKEVIVTVTKGKVRVEDGSTILGIITPNQQISFSKEQAVAKQLAVDTTTFISWKDKAYTLDDISIDDALTELQIRYGVVIELANKEKGGECRFTASFHQNESLGYVLDVICKLNKATWKKDADRIIIEGVQCN